MSYPHSFEEPSNSAQSANNNELSPLHSGRDGVSALDIDQIDPREPEGTFQWRRLLSIFSRRKRVMQAVMLVSLASALGYLAVAPKIYRASADVLVNAEQKSSSNFSDSLPTLSLLAEATSTRSQETEVEILKSSSVQKAAIGLLPDTMSRSVKENTTVEVQPKRLTDIISVSVQSRNPDIAVAFSNAICKAYQLQNQENNTQQYRETAKYVGGQLELVRKKLDEKRAELRNFKTRNGIVDLTTESQARITRLSELTKDYQQTEAERQAAEAQLKNLRTEANRLTPAEVVPDIIVPRPVIQQIKQQLTNLETQRLSVLQEFTDDSPEVQTLDEQIKELRNRLKTEAQTEVGSYRRTVNPIRQDTLRSIAQAQATAWATQSRLSALKQDLAKANNQVQQLPESEYHLSQLQADLATYQQTFQSLSDKYQTLLISQETPIANARVVTPAEHAIRISPRITPVISLAVVFGMILAIALAVIVDTLDNKIYSEEEIRQITGLPVLTHVPYLSKKEEQIILDSTMTSSALLESFRMLRAQLGFVTSYKHIQSLLITSSQAGEGKSFVSTNLAIALALNGARVILMDADLRRPRVHSLFNLANDRGFTSVVTGTCSLEEALQPTSINGLQVLTSGPLPPNPPELLDSVDARNVIAQLKAQVDFLIIDAPPALIIADAQVAATLADGTLIVVSCKEISRSSVERTTALMSRTGIPVVGFVLNKFVAENTGYYSYYGYGNYTYKSDEPDNDGNGAIQPKA